MIVKTECFPRIRCLFVIVLISLIGAGCNPPPPTALPTVSPLITNLLQQSVCQLPCWESITPGTTSLNDVIEQLENLPDVGQLRGPSDYLRGELAVSWEFRSSKGSGSVIVDAKSLVVKTITFGIRRDEEPMAQTIIPTYIQPTHIVVRVTAGHNFFAVLLLEQSRGVALSLGVESNSRLEIEIKPEAKIGSIEFYPPNQHEYVLHPDYANSLLPWQGFMTYPIVYP